MTPAEIDKLSDEVEATLAKLDAALGKVKHKVTVESADDEFDDPANPSLQSENGDGDSDLEEDEDEEDTSKRLRKASNTYHQNTNDGSNRPGSLSSSTHKPNRHKFEAMAEKIANEEGIPKSEATRQARLRFPDVYAAYQRHAANGVAKSAPADFETLVSAEMQKGCNYEVGAQRVMQMYGSAALRNSAITKRADFVEDRFTDFADDNLAGRCVVEQMRGSEKGAAVAS
jgi:hypothetical protein